MSTNRYLVLIPAFALVMLATGALSAVWVLSVRPDGVAVALIACQALGVGYLACGSWHEWRRTWRQARRLRQATDAEWEEVAADRLRNFEREEVALKLARAVVRRNGMPIGDDESDTLADQTVRVADRLEQQLMAEADPIAYHRVRDLAIAGILDLAQVTADPDALDDHIFRARSVHAAIVRESTRRAVDEAAADARPTASRLSASVQAVQAVAPGHP